jgi:uncharacterized protein YgbK (DUF1537 family)
MNSQLYIHQNPPQLTILADDLTGAADAAGYFGDLRLTAVVTLDGTASYRADVLVINTNSRHLSQTEAARRNTLAMSRIFPRQDTIPSRWIYKKIDSTLRGHPGAELKAIMNTLGCKHALVAPAFPEQGRTTVDGIQLLNDQPLENTIFRTQVASSNLSAAFKPCTNDHQLYSIELSIVRTGVSAVQRRLQEQVPTIYLADAETAQDLRILAEAAIAQDIRMFCGSAGLSRALGQVLPLKSFVPAPTVPIRIGGPILVVAGSRHPTTNLQIEYSSNTSIVIVSLTSQENETMQSALNPLSKGQDVILTTDNITTPRRIDPKIAKSLGRITKSISKEVDLGGLVLTGGDTALTLLQSLGCRILWLQGELEPGIPWGRLLTGTQPGLAVVTKAGGFGNKQTLTTVLKQLKKITMRSPNVPTQ